MSIALSDGTYYMVPRVAVNKALDVANAADYNGANVGIYTQNTKDAQILHVMTLSDGSRYIKFPLTGCFLDFGDPNGNVFQYAESGSPGQRWDISDSGTTFTANGTSREAYFVKAFNGEDKALSAYAKGTTTVNGNAQWNVFSSTNIGELWAFVPMPTVIDGTYIMRSSYDLDLCTDVEFLSKRDFANVQICSINGGNNQVVAIKSNGDGTVAIFDVNSGKVYRTDTETPSAGSNVNIFHHDGSKTQKWVLQQKGVRKMGVETWPTVEIKNAAGSNFCLDVCGASTIPGTNVQLYPDNDTAAQRFLLDPTEAFEPSLSVPSGHALRLPDGRDQTTPWGNCPSYNGVTDSTENADGTWTTKFYPSFFCKDDTIQMRYKLKSYSATNHNSYSEGPWRSIRDGSVANFGWGTIWRSNVTMQHKGNRLVSPYPISVTVGSKNGQYDKVEVIISARAFTEHYGSGDAMAHGSDSPTSMYVNWSATPTFSSIARAFGELWIPYTSDLPSICTTAKMIIKGYRANGSVLFSEYTNTGLCASDTFKIPLSKINGSLADGEKITLRCELFTAYGVGRYTTNTDIVVSSDTDHGIIVKPTWTYDDTRRAYLVTFNKGTSNKCWVYVSHGHGGAWESMPPISSTSSTITYLVMPQLNKSTDMICEAYTSDTKWGFNRDTLPTINTDDSVWNWGVLTGNSTWQGVAALTVDKDDPPTHDYDLSPDFDKHTTTGREHEVVTFGQSVAGSMKASGLIVPSLPISAQHEANFDWLAYSGKNGYDVIYRDPMQRWAHVAITGISQPHQYDNRSKIEVSMVEVTP